MIIRLTVALNAWMQNYAQKHGMIYLDFYSATVDSRPGMKQELSYDGVHPNKAGYKVMEPLVEDEIAKALKMK